MRFGTGRIRPCDAIVIGLGVGGLGDSTVDVDDYGIRYTDLCELRAWWRRVWRRVGM